MRARFAPSPTGSLHLGNARTALVNWLVARASGAAFVLRIEDTDIERNRPGAEQALLTDLAWLGLDWDEGPDVGGEHGPYRQSERAGRYRAVVDALLETGAAYRCFCGADEPTDELPRKQDPEERTYQYPGTCRGLDAETSLRRVEAGESAAVRFRVPDRAISFVDGLRGSTGVAAGEMGDFVIARADGRPTYQLAVVVDDHDMEIDHVIRGQDHLSNTPRQLLLYEAMSWNAPRFTHLPLVLGEDRRRLSKRHGASSVAQMRAGGIVPEALLNYLVLLGWSPPEGKEVLGAGEILESFVLESLSTVNAVFDESKLGWLNQQHLGRLDGEVLRTRASPFLAAAGYVIPASQEHRDWWQEALELVCPALRRLDELPAALAPIFRPSCRLEDEPNEGTASALSAFRAAGRQGVLISPDSFRLAAREIAADTGVKGRALFHPLRIALTGTDNGPELARLIPLIEAGSALGIEPRVPSIVERLDSVLASS